MALSHTPRLDSVFGATLDQVTAEHIQGLVTNGVSEEFDLDFKRDLYGRADSPKRELCGDVAALANTAGGVIVIGVDEDDQARACGAPGVEISDEERARMLQVVASGVSPMPPIEIRSVASADDGARGYFLLVVARSPKAPHAVIINDGYRFPMRNGATTRYLSEPELAAAYRARHASEVERDARLDVVDQEAAAKLDLTAGPWVLVSLVPDLSGALEVTSAAHNEFSQRLMNKDAGSVVRTGSGYNRMRTGRRRLIADGGRWGEQVARYCFFECHTDGAAAHALETFDYNTRNGQADQEKPQMVLDESIVVGVLSGLLRTARHAVMAGAGGNAIVRASLLPTDGKAYEIGHNRQWGLGDSRSSAPMTSPATAETVVSLAEASLEGPALVAAAARLVDELAQSFGFPEMGQLTREGDIRIRYWGQSWAGEIKAWAERAGVPVTAQTL